MNPPIPPEDGLERAARLVLARARQPQPEPVSQLLARHPELSEWLEPMLREEPEADEASEPAGGEPRRLGPFLLAREIGRGGMGVVFEARRDGDPEPLALKVLSGFLALQPARAERFRREAAVAGQLHHDGVVRVVDTGAVADTLWLAMEFVVGAPLDAVLRQLAGRDPSTLTAEDLGAAVAACQHVPQGALSPTPTAFEGSYSAAVARVCLRLAEALSHLHRAGVIHRDVKPSNVLLCADGRVVLTDFGLARASADESLTLTGDFAGTPNYVSPEQAMAKRVAVDHRSDLFSLGSTFYELLTLQKAFPGDSLPEALGRIVGKEPVPATRLHRRLSPDLVTVLQKLLEKDPDRRYRDADALCEDLRSFLAYRPVAAQRVRTLTRVVRWSRREPLRATLAAVVAVTLLSLTAGAGYLWARRDEIRAGREQLRATRLHELVDAGHLAVLRGAHEAAVQHFEQAFAIDPGSAEAGVGLALTVLRREGAEAAAKRIEQRLTQLPPRLLDLLRFAVLNRLGRPEAVALGLALAPPTTAEEHFVYGALDADAYVAGGVDALEHLERAVLASDRPRLWLHAYWAIHADRAKHDASCRRAAASLLATWPDSDVATLFVVLALRRVEPERALALVQARLDAQPDNGLLYWARGNVHEVRGEFASAVADMERTVELLPDYPGAHYTLGRLRYERSDVEGALRDMQRARDLSPTFVEPWLGIGMAQRRLGDHAAALAALRRAVELHGSHPEVRFQLGQTLVQQGELAEGRAELERAVDLDPRDANKWHHVAFARYRTGDDEGGAEALRQAIRAQPQYERAYVVFAMMLDQTGKSRELGEALRAWVAALPRSVEGWLQLGRYCLREDVGAGAPDAANAVWAAERVCELSDGASGAGWLVLGDARALLGQRDAARSAWQRALAAPQALSDEERQRCERLLAEAPVGEPRPAGGR